MALVFACHGAEAATKECDAQPASPLVVNVKDKGAKGDGRTDDTAAIQAAIDEVAGTGGTVLVPGGVYLVETVSKKKRLELKSDMTFRMAKDAVLKAIPNSAKKYSLLLISGASKVNVVGGTLEGERDRHKGKAGEGGMGIRIDRGASRIVVSHVTARMMWGDGFYIQDAKDVVFCGVVADRNRRQGLSIIAAEDVLVTESIFRNTGGTRPSAGIDLEPNDASQKIVGIRINQSQFLNNVGPGIQISGKKGAVKKIELSRNVFKGNRPFLVEDAPGVLPTSICDNRQVTQQAAGSQSLNAFADPIEMVVHQNDCEEGRDPRFEVNRSKRKRSQ